MEANDNVSFGNYSLDYLDVNGSYDNTTAGYTNQHYIAQIDVKLFEKYYRNRAVSNTAYWSLIVSYSFLIFLGFLGNLLVIFAVVNNKSKWVSNALWLLQQSIFTNITTFLLFCSFHLLMILV